jgi:hypothetical protein
MIIPRSRDCQDVVASIAATDSAYMALALTQIATAVASGAYSCTLTVSGKTAQDVMRMRKLLSELGYRLTQTTTTITILWDNSYPAQLNA